MGSAELLGKTQEQIKAERVKVDVRWVQENLKREIAQMHDAIDRHGILGHLSKVRAYLGFAPSGFHTAVELTPGVVRLLSRDPRYTPFLKKGYSEDAERTYLHLGVLIGERKFQLDVSPDMSNPQFILQEIFGFRLGIEKKLNSHDLVSAKVIAESDLTSPQTPKS